MQDDTNLLSTELLQTSVYQTVNSRQTAFHYWIRQYYIRTTYTARCKQTWQLTHKTVCPYSVKTGYCDAAALFIFNIAVLKSLTEFHLPSETESCLSWLFPPNVETDILKLLFLSEPSVQQFGLLFLSQITLFLVSTLFTNTKRPHSLYSKYTRYILPSTTY